MWSSLVCSTNIRLFIRSPNINICIGAANGIGKETALRFASYGCVRIVTRLKFFSRVADVTSSARIVIGDRDLKNANTVVEEIKKAGGYYWRSFLSGVNRH